MRGYRYTSGDVIISSGTPTEAKGTYTLQFNGFKVKSENPILLAMYIQREQRRSLFQRQIISRSIPEAIHSIPRQRFLESTHDS